MPLRLIASSTAPRDGADGGHRQHGGVRAGSANGTQITLTRAPLRAPAVSGGRVNAHARVGEPLKDLLVQCRSVATKTRSAMKATDTTSGLMTIASSKAASRSESRAPDARLETTFATTS